MRAALAGGLVLLAALPGAGFAQQSVTSGTVIRAGASDTTPLAGARVVLHRIGRDVQGPIDSVVSDRLGRFRFRFTADTTAIYLLSSNYAGIEYFSSPVHVNPAAPDTGLSLVVSDTSGTVPVATLSRHVVVSRPDNEGRRSALEIVVLENAATLTRVAGDTTRPTWAARLPAGVLGAQAGSGDYSPEAIVFRNDSVLLFAPVAPGNKQLVYTYSFPPGPGTVKLPVTDSIAALNVLLEEADIEVRWPGVGDGGTQTIEGRTFHQWGGAAAAGQVVEIAFGGSLGKWILPALVGLLALALLVLTLRALGTRGARATAPAAGPLLEQLARLDARYAGQEAHTPPEEWLRYQAERAELKARLAGQLAAKEPQS